MPNWLVTGSSRGIGFELVKQLAAAPDNTIFATCRSPASATALKELAASHKNVHIVALDADSSESALKAAAEVKALLGGSGAGIDFLINNAGICPFTPLDEAAFDEYEAVFRTNVGGPLRVFQAFRPLVQASARKVVVNISSELGSVGLVGAHPMLQANFPSYAASKAALNILTRKMQVQYPELTIFALAPGYVKTDMNGHADGATDATTAVQHHLKTYAAATRETHGNKFLNMVGEEVPW